LIFKVGVKGKRIKGAGGTRTCHASQWPSKAGQYKFFKFFQAVASLPLYKISTYFTVFIWDVRD
jgi:hypothetical protein